jgi:RNA polymerase sigma factor (sigma-70 family)
MERHTDLQRRCAMVVAALSVELDEGLNVEAQWEYSASLPQYLPENCSDSQLRAVALHYHLDHTLVQALLQREHAVHDAAWHLWMSQVMPILRHAGLAWSDDSAIDLEDLAQVARAELVQALPSFRYASRFSTWAYQVIVQSTQRYIRDRRALKRAGHPDSLERLEAEEQPVIDTERPDAEAEARVLAALIDSILGAQPDQRFTAIFRLWAQHDMRVEEIGQRVRLSPSQVRVLLKRIRQLLRQHPAITTWEDDQPQDEG